MEGFYRLDKNDQPIDVRPFNMRKVRKVKPKLFISVIMPNGLMVI